LFTVTSSGWSVAVDADPAASEVVVFPLTVTFVRVIVPEPLE